VAIVHRLGELAVEEVSVAIAVGHPHRDTAYALSRWVIEELKSRVPIWKREHYVDGTREWVDPTGQPRAGATT
jgi:molybdopterin synthase catalytic subunit